MAEESNNLFDYSKYRHLYSEIAIIKQFWVSHPPDEEKQAELEFSIIDKGELIKYLTEILDRCEQIVSNSANLFYTKKMNQIKRKYTNSDLIKSQRLQLIKEISDFVYRDSSIYMRALKMLEIKSKSNNKNELIAKKSVELFDKMDLNIDKLIHITDFKTNAEESILYLNLYKRFVENCFERFDEIFLEVEKFQDIIRRLKENNDVKIIDSVCQWNEIVDEKKLKVKTLICVLSIILEIRGYYKINPTNTLIVNLLNSFFGIGISYSYFGRIKNTIISSMSTSSSSSKFDFYISHFFYIPEV